MSKAKKRRTSAKKNVYQQVTDTIIELLEGQLEGWKRPWLVFGQDGDYARNATSRAYYRGINQFLLGFAMMKGDFFKSNWLTYKQAQALGGHVRKGEKGQAIAFYKTAYIDEAGKYYGKDTYDQLSEGQRQNLGVKVIPMLKLYTVFNVAQTEGLDPIHYAVQASEPLQDIERDDRAEALIRATGAQIEITESNRAYYDRSRDLIKLPLREQFRGVAENFYATALHELVHWSGAEHRLNRPFGKTFGDSQYAKEELIAELGAAFCSAALGFEHSITNSAAYLQSWIGILKADNRAILRIAARAQRAADYLLKDTPYEIERVQPTAE